MTATGSTFDDDAGLDGGTAAEYRLRPR